MRQEGRCFYKLSTNGSDQIGTDGYVSSSPPVPETLRHLGHSEMIRVDPKADVKKTFIDGWLKLGWCADSTGRGSKPLDRGHLEYVWISSLILQTS